MNVSPMGPGDLQGLGVLVAFWPATAKLCMQGPGLVGSGTHIPTELWSKPLPQTGCLWTVQLATVAERHFWALLSGVGVAPCCVTGSC